MAELFDAFPSLQGEHILIHKIAETDVDALAEITGSERVYRYIPPFLYQKSKGALLTAIRNLGGRDFDKKKLIIAGIYPRDDPARLVGLAEMFDYKKRADQLTIGYRINEAYWHRGIATEAVRLMTAYLSEEIGIGTLRAFVMPENVYSARALLRNGFCKEPDLVQEKNWGGQETVDLAVYTYRRNA